MMRSLFSGVSGLKNHQTRMDVIGNNISNVNTTGFKSSRVNFTDMLSQTLSGASKGDGSVGGTNPKQIGLGSAVGAIDLLFTNGSVQSTGVNTDLALSSTNALFILGKGSETNKVYTRNGDFQFDADGNYVQAGNGYYVLGWMADDKGDITPTPFVKKITIPSGKTMEPTATKNITFLNNLDASTEVGGEIVTIAKVYDTLGISHDVTLKFTKNAPAQEGGEWTSPWKVTLVSVSGDGSPATPSTMDEVTLRFNETGTVRDGDTGTAKLILTNGAQGTQEITIDLKALTQYDSSSTLAGDADGNASGVLQSISIDKSGTITGTYTNGKKRTEAQVALQRFTNPGGLNKIGESIYEDSNNAGLSGSPNTASALGATITPSALEMSNVDVANEFTDMIITQRGFQGNSKIITVSDEMLETLINMKR